jgi:hypothetical protein
METNLQDLPDNIELPNDYTDNSDVNGDAVVDQQQFLEACTPIDELQTVFIEPKSPKFSLRTYLMSCSREPLIVFIVSLLVINPLTSNLLLKLVYNVVPLLGKMNENLYVAAIVYSLLITILYMFTNEFIVN